MDRLGSVAGQQGEVMHLAHRAGLDDEARRGAQALGDQVLVHRARGEQRRNRHVLGVERAVGDDQDVEARLHRVHRLRAQRREARLDAFLAPRERVADVEFEGAELVRRVVLDRTHLRHVLEVEHGLAHLEAHRRVDVVDVEQVGLRPDEAHQRHHHLFADRVDRRVRDLREQLLEVAVERLGLVRQHRQRAVVAHRADRLLALQRHRLHQQLDVFLRVAERLLAVEQRDVDARGGRRLLAGAGGQVVELDADALDPLLVRLARGELLLELGVVDDAALLGVDQEHLAGLQAPLLEDAAFRDRQHADLRGHHHHVVVGDHVARRAQAVAVERRADAHAVGERDGRRAVPRLHHRRVVLVERAARVVHRRVLLPRLGDHHHHGVRERVAAHHQQFERVVEAGGVGLAVVDQREELVQVVTQHRRRHHALARADPVEVALDRVDLAVVRDQAVRVRQFPRREGVGREALVHQRDRRHDARIGEVRVIAADLVGEQQALVDHRARRDRRHEVLLAVLQLQRLDLVAGGLADDVQLALEGVGHHHVGAAADEDLADHRLAVLHERRHRHRTVDRHVAPAEHDLAFRAHRALEFLFAGQPRSVFARQEDHADAVLAGRRQGDALLREFLPVVARPGSAAGCRRRHRTGHPRRRRPDGPGSAGSAAPAGPARGSPVP